MFKQITFLTLCLLIILTAVATKTSSSKINRQKPVFASEYRPWLEGLINDLEFAYLEGKKREDLAIEMVTSILKRSTPFVQYFENNMKIFSELGSNPKYPYLSTKTIPIGWNEPCEPKNHLKVDPLQVMNRSKDDTIFFDALKDWQNLVMNDNKIRICNVHLGLVCDPVSTKCTCRPETEWILNEFQEYFPGGKCYLFPDAQCTFRRFEEHNDFDYDQINWFVRMVIHPMTHPICGERVGTKCDTFDTAPAKCWCLDNADTTKRPNCKGKTTWIEAAPDEIKLEQLFQQLYSYCEPLNPDLMKLIYTLLNDPLANTMHIYRELIKNGKGLCRFRDNEFCIRNQCVNNGNFRKCLPHEALDHNYNCKLKNAERCVFRPETNKCFSGTKCRQFTNSKTGEKGAACLCEQQSVFQNNRFGDICERNDKPFFLKLFKPILSGIDGSDFRTEENTLYEDLSLFEQLLTLDFGKQCEPQKHVDISMGIVNYFGNMEQLTESEYKPLLDKVKGLYKPGASAIPGPFCDHRKFLTCDPLNSTCGRMHKGLQSYATWREIRFAKGHVCNEPVDILKIYYGEKQRPKEFQFECIQDSFCILDYSHPVEETIDYKGIKTHKKHCRCRRGRTGQDCEIEGDPEPYTEREIKKLAEFIEFRMNRSVREFQQTCFLDIERKFPREIEMTLETTDLYELISSLEPHLKSIEPLEPLDEGLTFCDVRLLLRCTVRVWNFTKPEENLIGCYCMDGFEWVNWPWDKRPKGCYIIDGNVCDASDGTGPKCASNRCEMNPRSNVHECQDDNSFSYFSEKSEGDRRKMQLLFVTTITVIAGIYTRFND